MEPVTIQVADHPLLALAAFETRFAEPAASQPWLVALLKDDADAPLQRSEELRKRVRDLLRHGGYKPTGRGKPASEYLVKAVDRLGAINLAVDACNDVSLHSGLPISVIDLDRAEPPLSVKVVEEDVDYVFNTSGQSIRLKGLLCLHDALGPCANAVKDSQRTKTSDETWRTLSLIWGTKDDVEQTRSAERWYRELLEKTGASTHDVTLA